ncbi:YigZ family protein [Homoserinimonas sp. OAct 916]|uniref:IMPACT family protein n=1 Tax=Homoserinimonas sp. OAct 916 TaxID=2211450 RepID=UPI000DBE29AC|nr:YigZ family protein [Homoserinimonas sp. OAct 916]
MQNLTLRGGVGARVDAAIEIKRSRFLTRLVRVEREEEARLVVDEARREHWKARHHCTAFVLGANGSADQIRRSNDDGEPSGTAGAPILAALQGAGFIDSIAVVTRYFGGVLLGAGGLARAYSEAVVAAIELAQNNSLVVRRTEQALFALTLDHATAGQVEAELRSRRVEVVKAGYGEEVELMLSHPDGDALSAIVADLTAGRAVIKPRGTRWIDVEPAAH